MFIIILLLLLHSSRVVIIKQKKYMYINHKFTSIPLSLTFICESLGILKLIQIINNIIAMNYFSML